MTPPRSAVAGYAAAVLATALVTLTRLGLADRLVEAAPFLPFVSAVAVAAWLGGLGPGLVATALGAVAGTALFLKPGEPHNLAGDAVHAAMFVAVGAVVSFLCEALHRSRRREAEGHARLAATLDGMGDAFSRLDAAWRFVAVNRRYEEESGMAAGELLGRDFWEVWPGAAGTRLEAEMRRTAAEGVPAEWENYYAPLGRWFRVRLHPAAGGGLTMFSHDVTAAVRQRAELAASHERLRAFLDNSPDVMAAKDGDGRYTLFNDALARLAAGRDPLGAADAELFDAGTAARFARQDGEVRAAQASRVFEDEFELGGRAWCFLTSKFPLAGGAVGVVATDVTGLKAAERELRLHRERLDLVVSAGGVGLWYCDLPFDKLVWNAQVKEHFGLPPDAEVTIDTFYERVHPEDRDRTRAAIAESIENRTHYDVEYRTVGPAGRVRCVRAIGRTFYGGDGRPARFDGITIEVTDRVRQEAELRRSEARANLALDVARTGAWTWDPATNAVTADARCREVAGLRPDGHLSLADLAGAVHPGDWVRVEAALLASMAAGGPGRFAAEFRFLHPGGGARWVSARGQNLSGESPAGLIGTLLDITEQKAAEAALRDADRRKDEFIAVLAHELRNPLAPIRNGLQVLKPAVAGPAEATRAMMERQLDHLVVLVDDLLDVSRITQGKLTLRRGPADLAEAVAHAVEATRPAIDAQRHRLAVECASGPVRVDGDPTRLAQVVANLLSNSAKYTPPGGAIRLTLARDGGEAVVAVADDGVGIPAESLGKIFGLFSQIDRAIEKTTGGLGIGLALVKGLVEMHGGTITAASDGEGRGSTFTIRLPLLPADAPIPEAPAAAGNGEGPRPRRVLVVDDNADAADSLALLLEISGHDVRTAYDGLQAVAAAAEFRPDLVLMDVGMPRLNGLDATRRIRAEGWGRGVHIVALTGWGQEQDRRNSADAGADGHLVKPVAPEAVFALLARLGGGPPPTPEGPGEQGVPPATRLH